MRPSILSSDHLRVPLLLRVQVRDDPLAPSDDAYVDKQVVIAAENDKAGVQNREPLQEADKNVHLSQVTKISPLCTRSKSSRAILSLSSP